MNEEDLEKTMPINNLDEINAEKNEPVLPKEINDDNIIPVMSNNNDELDTELLDDIKKDHFAWWKNMNTKNKVLIIIISILILLLVIGSILLVVLKKDNVKEEKPIIPEQEEIIVKKDNYIFKDGILTFLDEEGKEIGKYTCINKNEDNCYVAFYNNETSFDTAKLVNEKEEVIKIRSNIYNNKYVFINDNKSKDNIITLYNIETNKKEGIYEEIKDFTYNNIEYVIAKDNKGKYGLLNFSKDKLITIDFKYDDLAYLKGTDYLVSKTKNAYTLIDFNNKPKSAKFYDNIKYFNKEYIVLEKNKQYRLVTYQNKEIINKVNFIKLFKDYYGYVLDNKLYFKDYKNNKLYEEGIPLNNKNYIETKVFNDQGIKIKETLSFKASINGDKLLIDVYDNEIGKNYNIDLRDNKISQELKFYSYFDDKLYFYEDEAKEKLIGSYKCNNTNDVSKDSLTTCKIAFDTVYEDNYIISGDRNSLIPIINNRFVFIYDSPLLSNEDNVRINLYNLNTNKILSSYKSVNTHTPNNDGVLSHTSSENFEVIAELLSGKFGMISIGLTNATGLYPFEYDYMERLGDVVTAKKGNTWSIIYSKDLIVGNYPGKIMNIVGNYAIIKKDSKVCLYDKNSKEVLPNCYEYISVSDKYFGVVENKKVYIYDLNGLLINSEGFNLTSDDYLNKEQPVFKFSTNNGLDYIDIYNSKTGNYDTHLIKKDEPEVKPEPEPENKPDPEVKPEPEDKPNPEVKPEDDKKEPESKPDENKGEVPNE